MTPVGIYCKKPYLTNIWKCLYSTCILVKVNITQGSEESQYIPLDTTCPENRSLAKLVLAGFENSANKGSLNLNKISPKRMAHCALAVQIFGQS